MKCACTFTNSGTIWTRTQLQEVPELLGDILITFVTPPKKTNPESSGSDSDGSDSDDIEPDESSDSSSDSSSVPSSDSDES